MGDVSPASTPSRARITGPALLVLNSPTKEHKGSKQGTGTFDVQLRAHSQQSLVQILYQHCFPLQGRGRSKVSCSVPEVQGEFSQDSPGVPLSPCLPNSP